MTDVACVGILVADIMVKPVEELPKRGLLKQVEGIQLHSGGNAMTASINLTKIGLSASVIGKVGCDYWGDFLINTLKQQGVETKNVARAKSCQTSTSVVMLSEDGERSFFHCVGANGKFRMSDVDWDVIQEADIIFVTGIFLLNEFDTYDLTDFLKKCRQLGKITAADVGWDSQNRWGELINPALPYINIFIPSIEEAREIAEKSTPETCAEVFFARGVGSVVIKLGKDGCYVQENSASAGQILPGCKNVTAVDTTGAGDSFCSGFLAAYSKGKTFLEAAKFANAAGAICVMSAGATTGMRSYDEIEEFLREHS